MDPSLMSLAIGFPGGWEWIVILAIGLLLFGKRLPEVGKSLGKSIVEFKKGLKGIEEDLDRAGENDQKEMLPPPEPKDSSTGVSGSRTGSNVNDREEAGTRQ